MQGQDSIANKVSLEHDFKRNASSDAFEFLIKDHADVDNLFAEYAKLKGNFDKAEDRKAIVEKIVMRISKHAHAEEIDVYPQIRDKMPNGTFFYDSLITDHTIVKYLMNSLLKMNPGTDPDMSELFDQTVEKFEANFKSHVKSEEHVFAMFKRQHLASADELKMMENKVIDEMMMGPMVPMKLNPISDLDMSGSKPGDKRKSQDILESGLSKQQEIAQGQGQGQRDTITVE